MLGNKRLAIAKKIVGTLMLPVIMYIIVMIACFSHGKMYFGTWPMWKSIMPGLAISIICAMGIGLQFNSGRFDFSGGAIMLLVSIIAGNVAKAHGSNVLLFCLLCIGLCVIFSIAVGLVYVYGKLPIAIVTIGMALLYEAVTCLIFDGTGINLVADMNLKAFSSYPLVLVPTILAILVYAFYTNLTVAGKQGQLLAMNQTSAVNIGINERNNVLVSYLYSGVIFGLASMIYASTALHKASFSSLTTVGELFTNILPVFIALMLGSFCNNTIGIIMGSLTLTLMSFGLTTVIDSDMGSAISMILTGIFVLAINVISGQGVNILKLFHRSLTATIN